MSAMKITVGNWTGDLEVAINLMDDEIREHLHGRSWASDQDFVDAYIAAHRAKFGEDFVVN